MPSSPQRILALETSGRTGSVAVGTGDGVLATATLSATMKHAAELIPTVQRLLKRSGWATDELTEVFVSIGPGSFTGLRIAVTVARTLAWSTGARVVAVPTLDALAANALDLQPPPDHLAVVLDAKRSQVYTAAFELTGDAYIRTAEPVLADPSAFLAACPRPLAVLGEGIPYHREAIDAGGVRVLDQALWSGRGDNVLRVGLPLARDGEYTPAGDLVPLYIRRPEAEEKWKQLHPEKFKSE